MKVNVISLDETRYFNIREEDKPYIKAIRSVYAYDPELGVHLCELIPSHELHYLHTYIDFGGRVEGARTQEELSERYCNEGGDDTCMHVADVRQFAKDNPTLHKECGTFDDMDSACEYLNGNWPF